MTVAGGRWQRSRWWGDQIRSLFKGENMGANPRLVSYLNRGKKESRREGREGGREGGREEGPECIAFILKSMCSIQGVGRGT